MGPANGRFAIATIGLLLDNTHALIESAGTACVRALMVGPKIGGIRRAPEQHNQTRYQKYEDRSHRVPLHRIPGHHSHQNQKAFFRAGVICERG